MREFESSPGPEELSLMGEDVTGRFSALSEGFTRDTDTTKETDTTLVSGHRRERAQRSSSRDSLPKTERDITPIPSIRPAKVRPPMRDSRTSSMMNERYPIFQPEVKTSNKGLKAIRRKVSESSLKAVRRITPSSRRASSAAKQRESSAESAKDQPRVAVSPIAENGPTQQPMLNRPRSMAYLGNFSRPRAPPETADETEQTSDLRLPTPRTVEHDPTKRAKSSVELRARYRTSNSDLRDSSINIRRRHIGTIVTPQTQFDDQTLQKIVDGPYAGELSLSTPTTAQASPVKSGKENTAPVLSPVPGSIVELSPLPSPGLAPACLPTSRVSASPSVSRASVRSSIRPDSAMQRRPRDGGGDSPGQRMAEGFLSSRRRERFESPGTSSPIFL